MSLSLCVYAVCMLVCMLSVNFVCELCVLSNVCGVSVVLGGESESWCLTCKSGNSLRFVCVDSWTNIMNRNGMNGSFYFYLCVVWCL